MKMKRIPIRDWISFNECRGTTQTCSYCKGKIRKGEIGLTIRQKTTSFGSYNVWVHLRCLNPFLQEIGDAFEENKEKLVGEAL